MKCKQNYVKLLMKIFRVLQSGKQEGNPTMQAKFDELKKGLE